MGADYSFYVKSIDNHARGFLTLIILAIGRVKPEQKFTKTDLVLLTTSEAAADGIEDIACTLFPTMTRPLLSDVVVLLL